MQSSFCFAESHPAHMKIPAGDSRQGSAERMTDGGWFTRWPVMDLRND
jgi:hypothetical protein